MEWSKYYVLDELVFRVSPRRFNSQPDNELCCMSVDFEIARIGHEAESVEDIDHNQIIVGSAKWDGCVNFSHGLDHICDPSELIQLAECVEYIYSASQEFLTSGSVPMSSKDHLKLKQL